VIVAVRVTARNYVEVGGKEELRVKMEGFVMGAEKRERSK
jgi:hypothetical protein